MHKIKILLWSFNSSFILLKSTHNICIALQQIINSELNLLTAATTVYIKWTDTGSIILNKPCTIENLWLQCHCRSAVNSVAFTLTVINRVIKGDTLVLSLINNEINSCGTWYLCRGDEHSLFNKCKSDKTNKDE